mmetsp:Transcript_17536/g.59934  ORF Transcript_17536/g.59934 Transcript_17536/m.59934 type:complete len:735 (+) Transcript_17536:445-2649(+)
MEPEAAAPADEALVGSDGDAAAGEGEPSRMAEAAPLPGAPDGAPKPSTEEVAETPPPAEEVLPTRDTVAANARPAVDHSRRKTYRFSASSDVDDRGAGKLPALKDGYRDGPPLRGREEVSTSGAEPASEDEASAVGTVPKQAVTTSVAHAAVETPGDSRGPSESGHGYADNSAAVNSRMSTGSKLVAKLGMVENTPSRRGLLDKVFGTQIDEDAEERRRNTHLLRERNRLRFNPKSPGRAQWDILIICIVFYNCVTLPLRVAFFDDTCRFSGWTAIDLLLDLVLLADVFVAFNTNELLDSGEYVDAWEVRRRYLRGWFFFDFASAVPVDLVLFLAGECGGGKDTRLLARLPRLLRLLRVPRLYRYVRRWEDLLPLNASAMRILKLTCGVLLFGHVNACVQFLASELEGFPEEGWVFSTGIEDADPWTQYTRSVFNALSHMLCIGYGSGPSRFVPVVAADIAAPVTNVDIWIVIISMMTGASFYVVLIGMMSSIMLSMDQSGARYTQGMDVWKQYFSYRRLPKDLRDRVLRYYQNKWHTRKLFDEGSMLSELNKCVRTDIKMHVAGELLEKVPIFKLCPDPVVAAVAEKLSMQVCLPDELIYSEGQIAEEMYFIASGEVEIVAIDGSLVTVLSEGSYFGEFPLIFPNVATRTASARSAVHVQLYALTRASFEGITEVYPELKEVMQQIAMARQARTAQAANSGANEHAARSVARRMSTVITAQGLGPLGKMGSRR